MHSALSCRSLYQAPPPRRSRRPAPRPRLPYIVPHGAAVRCRPASARLTPRPALRAPPPAPRAPPPAPTRHSRVSVGVCPSRYSAIAMTGTRVSLERGARAGRRRPLLNRSKPALFCDYFFKHNET
ncbi:hypothetical protein EVAR_94348_1 [Eumeta japonica]|uniref:Uncharacterized protein n=1 Tax=Eumeta variegata TaxID=151549 RepID=A0A4C1TPU4_EUMVA|nr:hypothetical protein EVAR_94348_1 [Eumeta japonica]